jgi:glycosyltransferase involved in cell wall biosynthesis
MAELLDKVDAKVKILRLTDDISSFRCIPNRIRILERHAVEKADIVIVTSIVLRERLSRARRDVVYIPNAVDYEFYQSADRSLPPEYRSMEGPVVVYVGAIDDWFDTDLLAFLARSHLAANFVLIGVPRISLKSFYKLKNVHLLGARSYCELPRYLWNATVGIIPFKRDPLVEAISPLKLYEYMACGLPVVATRWTELEAIGSPAFLADSYHEFDELLSYALAIGRRTEVVVASMKFAEENSWNNRAVSLLDIALKKLSESARL